MPISRDRLRSLSRRAMVAANVITALGLMATVALIWLECGWVKPVFRGPEEAFRHGTIGTELMPLPVAQVLPDLFPEHFLPGGRENGDWIDQFGFLRDSDPKANDRLPIGFVISNYSNFTG